MATDAQTAAENGENRSSFSIRSFAVFDLETTGLKPNSAQITEMAVVAVTREHFLAGLDAKNGPILPRVVSKICLPVEPNIPVEFGAEKVSGLNNGLLKDSNDFKSAFAAFSSFLSRLPGPICLIAHNGQKFDFTLLKNELRRNGLTMPDGIFRFDSLLWLPSIDKTFLSATEPAAPAVKSNKRNKMAAAAEPEMVEPLNVEPAIEEIGQKMAEMPRSSSPPPFVPIYSYTIDRGDNVVENWRSPPPPTILADENFQKSPLENGSNRPVGVGVANKSAKRSLFEIDGVSVTSSENVCITEFTQIKNGGNDLSQNGAQGAAADPPSAARNFIRQYGPPPRRGLEAIYEHFFNEKPPAAHTADGDCLALLRILMFYGRDFVRMVDCKAEPF